MKDIEISTFDAKNKLSSLIHQASKGQRIWITNRGKRLALLSSGVNETVKDTTSVLESFREIRSKSKPGNSIKSLINEGRSR